MSIFFGLLFARRFYCRSALSLSPGRTGGLFPRINAPIKSPLISEKKSEDRNYITIYYSPKYLLRRPAKALP